MVQLIDTHGRFVDEGDRRGIIRTQEITKDFLDGLHNDRIASRQVKAAENEKVASVPAVLVDLWMHQGFDFWNATASQIIAKLRRDDLHCFLATEKAV